MGEKPRGFNGARDPPPVSSDGGWWARKKRKELLLTAPRSAAGVRDGAGPGLARPRCA